MGCTERVTSLSETSSFITCFYHLWRHSPRRVLLFGNYIRSLLFPFWAICLHYKLLIQICYSSSANILIVGSFCKWRGTFFALHHFVQSWFYIRFPFVLVTVYKAIGCRVCWTKVIWFLFLSFKAKYIWSAKYPCSAWKGLDSHPVPKGIGQKTYCSWPQQK